MTADELKPETLAALADDIAKERGADLYVYAGDIRAEGYEMVCSALESADRSQRQPHAGLFLNTYGGNAHAAYRMARAFGHHYDELTLYVFGPCKSAGTLMALGFNKIVIGDRGELGPMDVQMASKDELYEYNSGLDMIQAMEFLQRHAKATFSSFLHDIRSNTGLATKSAGEMARQLAQGLFSGMYNQLDPVRLGHVQRPISIAQAYGRRLVARSKSLRDKEALDALVYDYPCHEFVIDRKEAKTSLFAENVVRCPTEKEDFLGNVLTQVFPAEQRNLEFHLLRSALEQEPSADGEKTSKAKPPGKRTSNLAGAKARRRVAK